MGWLGFWSQQSVYAALGRCCGMKCPLFLPGVSVRQYFVWFGIRLGILVWDGIVYNLKFNLGKGSKKILIIFMEFSMEGYKFSFFLFCGLIALKHILYDTSNS